MRLLKFRLNCLTRNSHGRPASGRRGTLASTEQRYCIFFINPDDGQRSDYMRNLSYAEAEQRVYALRFLKLSPFMERQWEEDEEEALYTLPGRLGR